MQRSPVSKVHGVSAAPLPCGTMRSWHSWLRLPPHAFGPAVLRAALRAHDSTTAHGRHGKAWGLRGLRGMTVAMICRAHA